MTGRVNDWNRQSMKKDGSKPTMGVRSTGSLFHSQAPVYMADGGDVEEARMKQRGLDASNKEYEAKSSWDKAKSSFTRLLEGNIDDPKSEAYKKYGAGRARMDDQLDAAIKEADEVKAKSEAKPAAKAPVMGLGMDERDRRMESAESYKPVEITPLPVSRPIESRPIPVAKREPTPQERRTAIRMNDVRSTTRRQREEAARAKDKKTFGAINRTESRRSQAEAAMRDDKKTY